MLVHNHFQVLPPFEELVELAHHNPEAFSMLKHDICEEMILSADPEIQTRLWEQQLHIDHVLNSCQSSTPPMLEHLDILPMDSRRNAPKNYGSMKNKKRQTAEIIPFPRCVNAESVF